MVFKGDIFGSGCQDEVATMINTDNFVTKGNQPKIDIFATQRRTLVCMPIKIALNVLQYAKGTSQAKAAKIKPITLALIDLQVA